MATTVFVVVVTFSYCSMWPWHRTHAACAWRAELHFALNVTEVCRWVEPGSWSPRQLAKHVLAVAVNAACQRLDRRRNITGIVERTLSPTGKHLLSSKTLRRWSTANVTVVHRISEHYHIIHMRGRKYMITGQSEQHWFHWSWTRRVHVHKQVQV